MRVKCLAQEHNTMTPARAGTRSSGSGVQRAKTTRLPRQPPYYFLTILINNSTYANDSNF